MGSFEKTALRVDDLGTGLLLQLPGLLSRSLSQLRLSPVTIDTAEIVIVDVTVVAVMTGVPRYG